MEEVLKQNVVGQDEAVQKVAHAIQMHHTGLPTLINQSVLSYFLDQQVLEKRKWQNTC